MTTTACPLLDISPDDCTCPRKWGGRDLDPACPVHNGERRARLRIWYLTGELAP